MNKDIIKRIMPLPVSVRQMPGHFRLDAKTTLKVGEKSLDFAGRFLSQRTMTACGFPLRSSSAGKITLSLLRNPDPGLGAEGYELAVKMNRIEIVANQSAGVFHGVQTLLQLLPPEIESQKPVNGIDWLVPCVQIRDYPKFSWRGLMLDVSRHFFTKQEVLSHIDHMVRYKFNRLHLHLTDDQGWRLEIKRYPKLTQVGAWRVPRISEWWQRKPPQTGEKPTYGGFYTQKDMREIIRYAFERGVAIMPEIDVPGHSMAALASYPGLACTKGPFDVNPGSPFWNKITNTLCIGKDQVFDFMDGVMTEVAEIFPFEYIHMGGDEATRVFWKKCPRCQARMRDLKLKDENELQSYFVKRVEKIIESKGRRLIGWDEILEGGLAPNATVMSWRGVKGGIKAAQMGHKVVMSPAPFYYLDLYQGDPVSEPPSFSMNRLRNCYELDPVPEGVDPRFILGGQGNLWSEFVPDFRHAQYMTWPRGLAIAETFWSYPAKKDWKAFVPRVEAQFQRLDAGGIKYARSIYDVAFSCCQMENGMLGVKLTTELDDLVIHYTWNGTDPDFTHPRYERPLAIPDGAKELRVITYRDGKPAGRKIVLPLTNYMQADSDVVFRCKRNRKGKIEVSIRTRKDLTIHYSWLGVRPDSTHPLYTKPLEIPAGAKELRAISYTGTDPVGKVILMTVEAMKKSILRK